MTQHAASPALTITRRGRLVLTCLVLGLVVMALVLVGGRSDATDERGAVAPTRTVVVESGDTLWDLAAEVAEPGRTQATVIEIQQLNSLPSVSLMTGQRLRIPLG